jgi:predicted RecB family endonuclease
VPGLEICKESESIAEFDLIFIRNHEIYSCECKAGINVDEQDCRRAKLAAELGLNHYYFATIASFGDDAIRKINDLQKDSDMRNMKIEVLQGNDLIGEAI